MTQPALSAQLHSVQSQMDTDPEGTIARLAEIGFTAVEASFMTGMPMEAMMTIRDGVAKYMPPGIELEMTMTPQASRKPLAPGELRQLLDAHGLGVSACHVYLPDGADAERIFDEQEALGNTDLVAVTGFEDFHDFDVLARTADRYNTAAEKAKARGMRIGYHNHFTEVAPVYDGRSALELFFDRLHPEIFAEVDIFWSFIGGRQPAELIEALGDRVRFVHVKDGPGVFGDLSSGPGRPSMPLGRGAVDVSSVLAATDRLDYWTLELEMMGDSAFDALADSVSFVRAQDMKAQV
ncbi:sugar phosphate isomerase/epimerase family protein [Arthrobacter sp. SD76]|uniref:sugar phosphate isomerase/epimerase family protein n=1 Tax=Arthrobacter sp. SD76 TaxID=3415007 RepID=UPI003C77074D